MAESNMHLKIFIDTTRKKVVFAHAGKETVDFILEILSLPVAYVICLLGKKDMVGCLGNLYESVENLTDSDFVPGKNREMLLQPKQDESWKGGFVNDGMILMDDLAVMPMSSIFALRRQYEGSALLEKEVDLGMIEASKLLKASLESNSVLTAVFYEDASTLLEKMTEDSEHVEVFFSRAGVKTSVAKFRKEIVRDRASFEKVLHSILPPGLREEEGMKANQNIAYDDSVHYMDCEDHLLSLEFREAEDRDVEVGKIGGEKREGEDEEEEDHLLSLEVREAEDRDVEVGKIGGEKREGEKGEEEDEEEEEEEEEVDYEKWHRQMMDMFEPDESSDDGKKYMDEVLFKEDDLAFKEDDLAFKEFLTKLSTVVIAIEVDEEVWGL